MTWPFAFLLVGYVVVAAAIWTLGEKLVRESRAGMQALPIVVVLWPVGVFLLIAVAMVSLIEFAFVSAADWLLERDEDRL